MVRQGVEWNTDCAGQLWTINYAGEDGKVHETETVNKTTLKQRLLCCKFNKEKILQPPLPLPPLLIITVIIHLKVRTTTTIKRTVEAIVVFYNLMRTVAADADTVDVADAAVAAVAAVAVAVVQPTLMFPIPNLPGGQSITTKMMSRSEHSKITTQ